MPRDFDALARCVLHPHPATPCGVVEGVSVELGLDRDHRLRARYRIAGEIDRLRVPRSPTRLDPDRLWEHTCCELFVAPVEGEGYVEWNFSPTGQVACFDFAAYRRPRPRSEPRAVELHQAVGARELELQVRVALPTELGDAARLSLTAVIEAGDGTRSYWALRHPCEQPDFHHRDGFVLTLTRTPSPAIVQEDSEPPRPP